MRTHFGRATVFMSLVALACLPFASCGSGSTVVGGFAGLIIGPGGGSGAAQNVLLEVPPGAFSIDHSIAILPQPDPLPIGDPGVDYFHGIMCIGPLGLELDVPGHVRCCYELFGLPKGATEYDLVLLEWDDVLQQMFVRPTAVQNTSTHCFDDFGYDFLGHIAIGIRTGPRFDFVFSGAPTVDAVHPLGGLLGSGNALYQADSGGVLLPVVIDGADGADDYLASYDGSRVMYTLMDPETDAISMWTSDLGFTPPFPSRQIVPDDSFSRSEPTFGWLGPQDRVYHQRDATLPVAPLLIGPSSPQALAAAPGDAGSPIVDLETQSAFFSVQDVRVSPDGSMVLVRWVEGGKGIFTHVDVIDAVTGATIGTDLPTSTSPFNFLGPDATPRWLDDSSGLYYIEDDGITVTRIDPDGSNPTTLYVLTVKQSVLVDFVVSTDGNGPPTGAFVRRDISAQLNGIVAPPPGPDFYATDLLAGGLYSETDLKGQFDVMDMVPLLQTDPDVSRVAVELLNQSRSIGVGGVAPQPTPGYTLVFEGNAIDANGQHLVSVIPTPLSHIDQKRGGLHPILAWVPFPPSVDASPIDYPFAGLYVTDSSGLGPTYVGPSGFSVAGPPRWLDSWRSAPGVHEFAPFVRTAPTHSPP